MAGKLVFPHLNENGHDNNQGKNIFLIRGERRSNEVKL